MQLIHYITCLSGCHRVGQYVADDSGYGYNACTYLVCTYGNEPWQDSYGNYKYYTKKQECPYGTFIPEYHTFDGYKNSNPCAGVGYDKHECNKPSKSHRHDNLIKKIVIYI